MSQISKLAIVALLSGAIFTPVAHAQSNGQNVLRNAVSSGNTADAQASILQDLQSAIRASEGPAIGDGSITIEDLDRINRAAENERIQLELERAQLERLRLEITRLTAINEAIETLRGDEEPQVVVDPLSTPEGRLAALQERRAQEREAEMETLPRVASIGGANGYMTVDLEMRNGTITTMTVGDITMKGFEILNINRQAITVKGPTGTTYRMMPMMAPEPVAEQNPMNPFGQMGGVFDLSSQLPPNGF